MPKDETEDVSMTDLFRQMLFETEDERQDRLQEEYQISDEDGINKLLTSNLSCDDKMSILNREKQRIDTLRIEMDNAEHRFRHSRFFINKMIEACNEIKDSLKMDVPLTIGGITISSATIYQLVTFLERHRLTELSIDQFAGLLRIGCRSAGILPAVQ